MSFQVLTATSMKVTTLFWKAALCSQDDVSDELTPSVITVIRVTTVMMEAVNAFETSVSLYHTARHIIPKDSHLHTRENLKSHLVCAGPPISYPKPHDGF
jgi:hypothetical protein